MANTSNKPVFFATPNTANTGVFVAGPNTADMVVYEAGPNTAKYVFYKAGPNYAEFSVFIAGCFPKSELVHITSDVRVPIGSLKVGDKISSWDIINNKLQYTEITKIHKYTVMDIICFNGSMRVSSSHPVMIMERELNGTIVTKWKAAFDIKVGDCVVGDGGKIINIYSRNYNWYDDGIEVLNLSTDVGVPFVVGNFVVRANNAKDNIVWADTLVTQKLIA